MSQKLYIENYSDFYTDEVLDFLHSHPGVIALEATQEGVRARSLLAIWDLVDEILDPKCDNYIKTIAYELLVRLIDDSRAR